MGVFLRTYKPLQLFMYSHDQDLAGWVVKDILVNKHLRLIGQETTSQGVFVGPLFYYLQIPFFLLTRMDPKGTLLLSILLGALSILSYYWCFSRIFNKKVGYVAAFIYAISSYIVFVDREVVPTTPVMLWCVWYFYALWQLSEGKQKAYLVLGFLIGLVWNFNLALILLVPLILLAQLLSKKYLSFVNLVLGAIIFLITFSPFIVFEFRHGFQQTKAIYLSLTTKKDYIPGTSSGLHKIDRVFQLINKNASSIYWGQRKPIKYSWTTNILIAMFMYLVIKKAIPNRILIIMTMWQIFYISFFTFNSINLSEYYLNGMNIVWIIILSVFVSEIIKGGKISRRIGYGLTILFIGSNVYGIFARPPNKSGYLERKAIVNFIDQDSKQHGYPCVSVSYITSPGNDLGYRYLFWLNKIHVNQPKSGSPVYTIVFPHSKVDRIDESFGALGLIFPNYNKYNQNEVKESCSGVNSNLTNPMFGYTE